MWSDHQRQTAAANPGKAPSPAAPADKTFDQELVSFREDIALVCALKPPKANRNSPAFKAAIALQDMVKGLYVEVSPAVYSRLPRHILFFYIKDRQVSQRRTACRLSPSHEAVKAVLLWPSAREELTHAVAATVFCSVSWTLPW